MAGWGGGLENSAPGLLREKQEAGLGVSRNEGRGESERGCLWAEVLAAEGATELGIRATFLRNPISGRWEGGTRLGIVGAKRGEGSSMMFSLKTDPSFRRV